MKVDKGIMDMLKTSELADRAGVNKETLRYYEREGLIKSIERTAGGYRNYTLEHLQRVLFIKNAQKLGFSLNEIRQLLALADGKIIECTEVRKIANSKIQKIDEQLVKLTQLKKVLTELVRQCTRTNKVNHCPIVESITEGIELKKSKRRRS